jgi:hypothetical protein
MQILWNLTAIASLLAVVFIITQDDGGDCSRIRAYWPACWSMPDARHERLTTSHAVKKGRRYRY